MNIDKLIHAEKIKAELKKSAYQKYHKYGKILPAGPTVDITGETVKTIDDCYFTIMYKNKMHMCFEFSVDSENTDVAGTHRLMKVI